jgi:chromosome partitioning protein
MVGQKALVSRRPLQELTAFFNCSLEEFRRAYQVKNSAVSVDSSEVRDFLTRGGFRYPKKVISFQMLKGGVAKTTTAFFVGQRLAHYGAKVLFVDLDQQANLSYALGFENENHPVWVDLIEGRKSVEELLVPLDENVDLIPSNLNNSVLDRVLMRTQRNWAMCVKGPLQKIVNNYDFVLIDLAPALSVINTAATVASSLVILPTNPDKFSMIGLKKHLDELKVTQAEFAAEFETKILFTKFDAREKMSELYLKECLQNYEDLLFQTYIRSSADVKNSLELKKDIFASKLGIRNDFDDLALEILNLKAGQLSLPVQVQREFANA